MSCHRVASVGLWSWPCRRRYSGVVSVWGWSHWYSSCTSSHGKLVPVQVQPLLGPSTASHGPVDTYGTGQQSEQYSDLELGHESISRSPHCRVHQTCRVLRRDQLWLGSACGTSPLARQLNWRRKHYKSLHLMPLCTDRSTLFSNAACDWKKIQSSAFPVRFLPCGQCNGDVRNFNPEAVQHVIDDRFAHLWPTNTSVLIR